MGLTTEEWQISSMSYSNGKRTPGWDQYHNDHHPSAINRARQRAEIPWILDRVRKYIGYRAKVLDLGCGYGFVANHLARKGHDLDGVDSDVHAIAAASLWDSTQSVRYHVGDIHNLPFASNSFDVILALDVLPHTERYADIFEEARRVLKPGGILIFNGHNRSLGRWFFSLAGGRWIKPKWLLRQVRRSGLEPIELCGFIPVLFQRSFWKYLFKKTVPEDFRFRLCTHHLCGYIGLARKRKFH